jgi:hypothetical protein
MPCDCVHCLNPACRKVIPPTNLEFGGPHILLNFEASMYGERPRYACSPACLKAAREQAARVCHHDESY